MTLYNIVTNEYFEANEYTTSGFIEDNRPHLFKEKPNIDFLRSYKGKKANSILSEIAKEDDKNFHRNIVMNGKINVGNDDGPEEVVSAAEKILKEFGIEYEIFENEDDTMEIKYKSWK